MPQHTHHPYSPHKASTAEPVVHPPLPETGGRRTQIVLNILSLFIALYAVDEVLGISNAFALKGMTNDDAEIHLESTAWMLFFDPVGAFLLAALLIAAFLIHRGSKLMLSFSDTPTKVGLITTASAFVLSLFRVSIIFPAFFSALGLGGSYLQNGSDVRTPAAEEFVLEPAQLIRYNDAGGVRIASTLTNNSLDSWQTASVAISYMDAAGTPCGTYEHTEEYIAPGQQRAITTEFLAAPIYYNDPSCVPVTAAAVLTSIDVDSRSDIPPADYEHAVPVFDALAPLEDPWIDGSTVKLSVTGTVGPGSMATLLNGTVLPVGFEVIDRQGLRLSWCATADEVSPEGNFTTGTFHSPVAPGEFHTVVALPGGC